MRAPATRVGTDFPPEFDGSVRAVYPRAAVIALEWPVGDVRLVTLVRDGVPMTAASVSVAPAALAEVTPLGRVACRASWLRTGSLEASLAGAKPFAGTLAAIDPPPAEALTDLARRLSLLADAGETSVVADASRVAVAGRLQLLEDATAEEDAERAGRAADSLVGLGPGLTPSGDDAICGFLLGCALLRERTPAVAVVRAVAASAWGRTAEESAQFLAMAARGRFGESLLAVAECLGEGDEAGLEQAGAECAAVGATSGADGLLGMAAALRTSTRRTAAVGVSA